MALHIAALVRNEAERFLPHILPIWNACADSLVVLDDGSTDETRALCTRAGAYVVDAEGGKVAWGAEAPKRARLFDLAWGVARIDDYILILDADMIPAKNPRVFMKTGADVVCFPLFDLWETSPRLMYREDEFWRGHLSPRAWMFKKTKHQHDPWEWSKRGVHCGHMPLNFKGESGVFAPRDYALMHYAYSSAELRAEKYIAYASVAAQLSEHEIAHACSIMDPSPETYLLEFNPEFRL